MKNTFPPYVPSALLASALLAFSLPSTANAASQTWSATPGTSNFATTTNWVGSPSAAPGNSTTTAQNTDIATFSGNSTQLSVNLAASRNMGGLTLDGAFSYTLTSTSSSVRYVLSAGGTTQMLSTATANQTVTGPIRIGVGAGSGYTIQNNATTANTFTVTDIRNDSGSAQTLVLTGSNTANNLVNGTIDETTGGANGLSVTKNGAGTWILGQANLYTGTTTLNAGLLGVGSSTALGNGTLTINGGALSSITSQRILANNVTIGGNFSFGGLGQSTTLNGTVDLGGTARSITMAQNSATLNGIVSNGGITLESSSSSRTLTLGGNNTYSGGTIINGGTLALGATGTLGSGSVTVSGGILDLGTKSVTNTLGALTAGGTVGNGTITNNSGTYDVQSGSVSAVLAGTNGLTKSTAGTVTLSGANTYNGTTSITAGSLQLGASNVIADTSVVTVSANGTLDLNGRTETINSLSGAGTIAFGTGGNLTVGDNGADIALSGSKTSSGTANVLTKVGANKLTLTTATGFVGTLNILGGVVDTGASSSALFSTSASNLLNLDGGTLRYTSGSSNTLSAGRVGQGVTLGAAGGTFSISGGTTGVDVGATISGNGTLAKSGSGILTLSAANSFTGNTTVTAGTLLVSNSTGSGLGTSNVAVTGGTLGGNGSFTGSVTINSAGVLAPGSSIQSLASGALTFTTGSTFAYEVDQSVATSVGADLQVVSGNLGLSGNVTLTLANLAGSTFANNTKFTLINYNGSWNNGLFTYNASTLADDSTFTFNGQSWQIDYNATSGGANFSGEFLGSSSFVNITVVPEPATWALLTMSLMTTLFLRRRNRS